MARQKIGSRGGHRRNEGKIRAEESSITVEKEILGSQDHLEV